MRLNKEQIKPYAKLVVDAYNGVSTHSKFNEEQRETGARELLKDLAKDYRNNKYVIFQIIEQAVAEILPKRVNETIGRFAEIRNFPHGTAPKFAVKNGNVEAYVVSDGARVQRHRVYKKSMMVYTDTIQAKVYEELARVQIGEVDFNELIDKAVEAIEDELYNLIYSALVGAYESLPPANKVTGADVDEKELDRLIQVIGSYGEPVILGTRMGLASLPEIDAAEARTDIYNQGFIGRYKGVPCIEIENTVLDETNEEFKFEDR